MRRRNPVTQRGAELVPALRAVDGQKSTDGVGNIVGGPAQRERLLLAHELADDRTVTGDHHLLDQRRAAPFDQDDLAHHLRLLPGAAELELACVGRVRLLDIQVLRILPAGGHAPRDILVVADHYAGNAGKRHTGCLIAPAGQVRLIPKRGHGDRHVCVVGQQRLAGGRMAAVDNPLIAGGRVERNNTDQRLARGRWRHCSRSAQDLLHQPQRVAQRIGAPAIGLAGRAAIAGYGDRVGRWVERLQIGGKVGPNLTRQPGAQDLAGPVAAQVGR